jgi:NAD+ diphosphatase
MASPFQRAYPPIQPAPGIAYWFPFQANKLIVQGNDQHITLIQRTLEDMASLHPSSVLYLGTLNDIPCLACEISPEQDLPDQWRAINMRLLSSQLDTAANGIAGYASHLLHWQSHHKYCPNCAHPTASIPASWGRICPDCGYSSYPTVTPAILVLVHDGGDKVLLVHKPEWHNRRSIIAGFVEPGETLEECVQREVQEEVGADVTDITYIGNQPWPYPDQLMVGFMARYSGGTIQPDQQELDAADWYEFDNLPELPPPTSLARQLVIQWVAQRQQQRTSAHVSN